MEGLNLFDSTVMGWIQENCHNPVTDRLFPVITYLGEKGVFWLVLAGLLFLLGRRKQGPGQAWRDCGFLMALAMLAGLLIGEICVKNLVCRPRPFQSYPEDLRLLIPPPSGFSFPSGHSCSSFAAAVVLFAFHRRWGAAALTLAVLIAFSRLFLFVHYPTDVLAGAALGVLCALGVLAGYRVWKGKRQRERGSGE